MLTVNERTPILYIYQHKLYYYEQATIFEGTERGDIKIE